MRPRLTRTARPAAALVAAASLTAALAACGYDPASVGDDGAARRSVESERSAARTSTETRQVAHLLADADALSRASEPFLSVGVDGRVASLAGQITGLAAEQSSAFADPDAEGSSQIPEDRLQGVIDSADADGYLGLLREHLPRLKASWSDLSGSADPELSGRARGWADRIEGLIRQLDAA